MPFPRQEKCKPKKGVPRQGHWGTPALSGWLHALLYPGPASRLGHTEEALLHMLALSCSQVISFLWNKALESFWRQVGCSGFGSFHTMQFFSSSQSESSSILLQRRDLTVGKLLPKGGEIFPQPGAGTSSPDCELLLLTQKLFWQSGNLNQLPVGKAKLKCQHKSEHRSTEQDACNVREEAGLYICLNQFPCLKTLQPPPCSVQILGVFIYCSN